MGGFLSALVVAAACLHVPCGKCLLSCGPAEYEVKQECCPMCNPGQYVFRHCTEHTSTTCASCPSNTYTDEHSGLESCMMCTVCDSTAGVRVKKKCSSTSDTLCEPLEGHYCTDPIKDVCQGAEQHTKCKPGQYIKRPGSASSDTVCGDCGNNTYSNGSFTSCRPHTQCQPGSENVKEGTSSSDSECQNNSNYLIIAVSVSVALVSVALIAVAVMVIKKTKRQNNPPADKMRKEQREILEINTERDVPSEDPD